MKKRFYLIIMAVAISACTTSPTGRSQLMLISPQSAIVESEKAYLNTVNDLDQKNQLVKDPLVVKRVRAITGRLITSATLMYPHSKNWKWSVAIIDDPKTVNAWCMAGGRMAIYTGIIDGLKLTDDEIAQIMGHEIAHALANHTAERMSRAMAINMGLTAAAAMAEENQLALSGAALAAKLALELPNSRASESESDRIGIEIAARAGYRPEAAVSLWLKMQKAGSKLMPEFLSTHPSSGNRAETLGALVPEMKALNVNGQKAAIYPVLIVQ